MKPQGKVNLTAAARFLMGRLWAPHIAHLPKVTHYELLHAVVIRYQAVTRRPN